MSNGEEKQFYLFLMRYFDESVKINLLRIADRYKVDIKEAMEIVIRDASRNCNIALTNLSMMELAGLITMGAKLKKSVGSMSHEKYVNHLIHETFTYFENERLKELRKKQ